MLIDDVNIKSFGAVLTRKVIQPATLESIYMWFEKAQLPSLLNQKFTFNIIDVHLYIKGSSESDVKGKVSALINKAKSSVINFGDDFYYKGYISSTPLIENTLKKETRKLTLNFVSYCYKAEIIETANRVASKTINVPGNLETPAIIEITPSIDIIDIVVTGLGEAFTLKNLKAGQKVIVNGEDDTVLQVGINKFPDFDSWEFPKLKPGSNTITFSKNNCDITIKYKPRWI